MPNDTASSNPSPQASSDAEIQLLKHAVRDLQARVADLERGVVRVGATDAGESRERTESRVGLTAINRIGAVTLAVGIVFFFKYAADNKWISGGGLVLVGILAGCLLVAVGNWLRSRSEPVFAQGLAGCGFAIGYISVYAAFGYYKTVGREAGFAGLVAISAAALALCFRFASPAIAAVGLIGAFSAPLLAHPTGGASWPYFVYLYVLSGISIQVVTTLHRSGEQSATLFLLPFAAFWALLSAHLLFGRHSPGEFAFAALLCAFNYFAYSFRTRATPQLFRYMYVCAHACLLCGALRLIDMWAAMAEPASRTSFESAADSVALGVYGLAVITYGVWRRSTINRIVGLILLGLVIAKLYIYDVWLLTRFYRITAFVGLGVLLLSASFLYSRLKQRTGEG